MNIALLGGMNPETQPAWIAAVEAQIKGDFDKTALLQYQHWQTGDKMDLATETKRLAELVSGWEDYMVFAKSAGSWVVLKAIQDRLVTPQKCVFAGIAVNFGRENDVPIDEWLHGFDIPSLFIQQTNDPAIGYLELGSLLDSHYVQHHEVVEVPGNDHQYSDIADVGQLITYFSTK